MAIVVIRATDRLELRLRYIDIIYYVNKLLLTVSILFSIICRFVYIHRKYVSAYEGVEFTQLVAYS